MARRTPLRSAAVLLAAAACLSSGCALTRMVQAIAPPPEVITMVDKSPPAVPDNMASAAQPTGIQPVSATGPGPAPVSIPMPPPGSAPLPPPTPLTADPHTRGTPTAAGAALGLQPWESPLDKAVELARKIDACTADNQALLARIRQLEANATQREQAVTESVREVEAAAEQLIRTRADVQALRREIAALRAKVAQVEREDAETLKAVIAALERLLDREENP